MFNFHKSALTKDPIIWWGLFAVWETVQKRARFGGCYSVFKGTNCPFDLKIVHLEDEKMPKMRKF